MTFSAGTKLGPYEILGPIGAGGMGEVYRAHDTKLGRDVAIKVLPESVAHDAERMARFEREAQVLASLNHPHIATIYGLEESNDVRALVMELVEGPTLAERIGRRAMSLVDTLPIAKQIVEGMEYAHERGIVHRDLKPANVKLTADGNVKVLDFGLAKALEPPVPAGNPSFSPTATLEWTRDGVILGTTAYMAPEQARGAIVDKRADIWAFGVVLYEMLTGRQPFAGATVSDTLAAVLTKEPDWNVIPAPIRRLVRRCMEKDPKRRLRDIGEARLALEENPEVEPQQVQKRGLLWRAAAGVPVVVSLVLGGLLWHAMRPASQPLMRLSVDLPEGIFGPILSPDGDRVVYMGRGEDGKRRLYTRALDQEQSSPIAGTEDGLYPFFSPDGQSVGFFANRKLRKVNVHGGGTVDLCDAPGGRAGGSWGEDGNIIVAPDDRSGFISVSSDGGAVQTVTRLHREQNEFSHRYPQILPGVQLLLFTAYTHKGSVDESSIEAVSLRTGERKTLVAGGTYGRYAPTGHLLYMRQGTLYAAPMDVKRLELTGLAVPVVEDVVSGQPVGSAQVDFSRNGTLVYVRGKPKQTLAWLDGAGQMQTLRAMPAEYSNAPLRFSPDGKRLALSIVQGNNTNVWLYEWQGDTWTHLTFTSGFDGYPVWSPDGKHIAFSSSRDGLMNLYWIRADGAGEAVRLTESNNLQVPVSFSPNGKWLAFMQNDPRTKYDLWTLPLEEVGSDHPKPGRPEPLLVTPSSEDMPMISRDGRWLAYESDESGIYEIYVRPFRRSGGKWQISTGGGNSPVWSKSGTELFYWSEEGMRVASYTVNDEAFTAGKSRVWVAKKDLSLFFDLDPNGKRFLVREATASAQRGPMHVTFLLNFFAELRRRAPTGK